MAGNKTKKGILGGKVNRSHSTYIPSAEKFIQVAEERPEVSKISLGKIYPGLRSKEVSIKFTSIRGGIKAHIVGTISAQDLYIYTSKPKETQEALEGLLQNKSEKKE